MSYAAIHRLAVREALRTELAQACGEIERATHAAVDKRDPSRVYCYGDLTTCDDFARGLREVTVVPMTVDMKNVQSDHKCRVYRGLPGWR